MSDLQETELGSLIDTGGAGSPVLFLHGFPDTPQLWLPVIERLRLRHRCIAPTLPGFGDSPLVPDYSLAGRADFVQRVLDHQGVGGAVDVVVHDHGGPFGLHWALTRPERVRRVVIISALWPPGYRWHFWARRWRTPWLGELIMWLYLRPVGRPIAEWEMRRGSRGLQPAQVAEVMSRLNPRFLANALALYRGTDAALFEGWHARWLELAKRIPVMTVWGARDPYLSVRHAEDFGARRVEILPDSGHWSPAEAPERAAALLLDFLG